MDKLKISDFAAHKMAIVGGLHGISPEDRERTIHLFSLLDKIGWMKVERILVGVAIMAVYFIPLICLLSLTRFALLTEPITVIGGIIVLCGGIYIILFPWHEEKKLVGELNEISPTQDYKRAVELMGKYLDRNLTEVAKKYVWTS